MFIIQFPHQLLILKHTFRLTLLAALYQKICTEFSSVSTCLSKLLEFAVIERLKSMSPPLQSGLDLV